MSKINGKFKPCPFCGSDKINIHYYDPYDGYQGNLGSYIVDCSHCGVRIERTDKSEAIKAWNRRAENGKAN